MTQMMLKVTGMRCGSCAISLEKKLSRLDGIKECHVSFGTESLMVEYDAAIVAVGQIEAVANNLGYQLQAMDLIMPASKSAPMPQGNNYPDHLVGHNEKAVSNQSTELDTALETELENDLNPPTTTRDLPLPLIVGIGLSCILVIGSLPMMLKPLWHDWSWFPQWLHQPKFQWLLATPVQFWCGLPFYRGAWLAWRSGIGTMDTLIVLGTTAAYGYSLIPTFAPHLLASINGHSMAADYVYYEASAITLVMVSLGRLLERRSRRQTRQALAHLLRLQPRIAHRLGNGGDDRTIRFVDTPIAQIQADDVLLVRPGEQIPTDGTVIDGNSMVDESMVTGESLPMPKTAGDWLIGGTLNQIGSLTMVAKRVGKDTLLGQIMALVQAAQGSKAPIQRVADQVTGYFVPWVIGIALLTFAGWWLWQGNFIFALNNAVCVLVISCPCALGLATPLSIMVGTGMGAKQGILFKNAASLEHLNRIKAIIFDKTGTLTQGKPVVWRSLGQLKSLCLAKMIALRSEHPLAQAIAQGDIAANHIDLENSLNNSLNNSHHDTLIDSHTVQVIQFQAMVGNGIYGQISIQQNETDGNGDARQLELVDLYIGQAAWLNQMGAHPKEFDHYQTHTDLWQSQGKTLVWVAQTNPSRCNITDVSGSLSEKLSEQTASPMPLKVMGVFALADAVKSDAAAVVQALQQQGITVGMLSGDQDAVAQIIAQEIGIPRAEVMAQVLPEGKAMAIKSRKAAIAKGSRHTRHNLIAMVGDGINDAPALAEADVSIAMGTGTDAAIAVADVTLLSGDLRNLPVALRLSHATMSNIRQNLGFAFGYNIVGIVIATGILYPWFSWLLNPAIAGTAMALSSISVVMNALRLRHFKLN